MILGLEDIHNQGIVHKDIKENNICLDEYGYLYIIDLGACQTIEQGKLNRGSTGGTFVYMAPEVIRFKRFGFQTDFFCVGVMLHYLLVGKRPYNEIKVVNKNYRQAIKDMRLERKN